MANWDYTTDVVIVGSGGGALCGALAARQQGLDVLVVEKTEFVGGSTAMSGGGIWIPNNPVMQAAGANDSEAEALAYFDAIVGDVGPASSPGRRRAYVHNGPRLIAFLQELGVPFRYADGYADYYCDAPGGKERGRTIEAFPFDTHRLGPWQQKLRPGMSAGLGLVGFGTELTAMSYYNRSVRGLAISARVLARTLEGKRRGQALTANGAALVGRLLLVALEQGAQIWTGGPVQDLIVEDGAVVGVVVQRYGHDMRVFTRRGVLLAAGGFSRNGEMRARWGGEQATSADWSLANPGDTGEVLETAMKLGAATDLLDEAIWLPMPLLPDGTPPSYPSRQLSAFSRARWRPGSIMVDATGRRFADEAMAYMELGQRMFARNREVPAIPTWLIFDDAFRRRCLFGVLPGRLPERWVRDGFIRRGRTLEEVAAQCGIDAGGLGQTVRQFNHYARTGVDAEFRRGESAYDRFMGDPSHRPNNCLAPLDRAPFYAVAIFPCDVGTCGGLLTDEHARVLTEGGQPIPGLYATGNLTASLMGRHYLGAGASIGPTCTFGYVAMQHLGGDPARTDRD
jgi:3-oxosteroid 1-dehydrogenase